MTTLLLTMFSDLQHLPRPSQPVVFFPALFVFVSFYYLISPYYTASRQKAWVLTTLSSFCMTLFSLPFVFDYIMGGMSVHAIRHATTSPLSGWMNTIFQAYLVADLIIGALHYRKHVNVLSGWVHHSLYILVNELAIRRSWAHIFAFCSIMELPTFVLALGTLHPRFRSDLFFGLSFFSTRIALHVCVLAAYARRSTRHELLGGSFAPAGILTAAFGMHAMWFVQCVKGNVRRWKKRMDERIKAKEGVVVLEEVKVAETSEGGVNVKVLDPSNLEVIVEPTPVDHSNDIKAESLYASLPELHRPTDTKTDLLNKDEYRMSRSEFLVRTPGSTGKNSLSEVRIQNTTPVPPSQQTSASAISPTSSVSPPFTPMSTSSSILLIPGTYPSFTSGVTMPERPSLQRRRLNSVDRALETLATLRTHAQAIKTHAQTIRTTAQVEALLRARQRVRGMYDRLPDRRVLYDYVGLNGFSGRAMREVRAY